MTNKHRDKLIRRIKNDTSLKFCINESVNYDTKVKIQELVNKRVFNNVTQEYMAKTCNVSTPTIKRFENLKSNNLKLFLDYKFILEDLPSRKKIKTPKWVFKN